jgi:predicted Fe-S protein YdhL (DUF1289 family)
MKNFRVELKVCEACGALWLRAVDQGAYCRGCERWLSEFPTPGTYRVRNRSKVERISLHRRNNASRSSRMAVCMGGAV